MAMNELDSLDTLPDLSPGLLAPVPVRRRRPRRYKIAWVLAGVFLIIGILPVMTLSSRLIERNKEALKTQQQVNQLGLAESLAHHLESYIDGQQQTLEVISEALSERARTDGAEALRAHLARRRTLSRFVTEDLVLLRYTHQDGDWVTAVHEGFETGAEIEGALSDEFARQMNAGRRGEVEVGRPFYSEQLGGPGVLMSVPVLRSQRRIGVISAISSISPVWREAIRASGGYSLFALTPEGELFTQPRGGRAQSDIEYQDLDIVKEFVASGGNRVMPFGAQDATGQAVVFIGAYFTTQHGWGVFVQAEETLAYSFVEIMKSDTRFHAMLAAVGAVVLGFLFAGWIGRPIRQLADSSVAFAEGEFAARVTVKSRNEIGELAETFNAMAETLQQYIARLKNAAVENSELFLGSIKALAAAIDEKDAYTHGHSERVKMYASTLARFLDLPPEEVRKIEIGALLHDVGKIGIQDRILNKPGPLTPEEYEEMKTHPVRGANIMAPIRQLREVIPCMKYHHERWDGGGYPEGLKGEEIPLAARVVTVADCWDAMTTNRPYQRAMEMDAAIDRFRKLAGAVFDRQLVDAFVEVLERGECAAIYDQARQQVEATSARIELDQVDPIASDMTDTTHIDPDCLPPRADG